MRLLDLVKPTDLSRVAKLRLLARQVVEGFCSGRHRSPQKGFSVEFKEHRQYMRGDELKNIDWKAFAKSDRLFIREFEEETNLKCHLLVDQSGSMRYAGDRSGDDGTGGVSKFDYARVLSASLGYLMLGQQDAVGVVTFDDQPRSVVPPKSRPSHLTAVIKAIANDAARRETDLGGVFRKIAPKLGRRGLIIVISDAMGDVESIGKALAQFRNSHHEVLFFQVLDPDEIDFPFNGRVQFRDLEDASNEQIVDAQSLRDRYLEKLAEHQSALRDVCRRNRIDLVQVITNQPMVDRLHEYFAWRRRKK